MNLHTVIRKPFRYAYGNSVLVLIGINIFVFFLTNMIRSSLEYLSMIPALVLQGWIWQFLTYMFVHADIMHILFNMLGLLVFGIRLEREWGTKEFLLFYILTGTLAGVFSFIAFLISGSMNVYLLGASGAVYALLLAYAATYPHSRIYIWGLIPIRAPVLVLIFAGINIFNEIFRMGGNMANLTHLAGFGFAYLYFVVRFGINPVKRFFERE